MKLSTASKFKQIKRRRILIKGVESGQAMVETVIVLMVTMLLVFGAIQFALIYNAKSTLNYATFEATRAGALNYGDKQSIQFALAAGLSPLFTSVDQADSMLDSVDAVKAARNRVLQEVQAEEFVCIQRLNPQQDAFNAHGIPDPNGMFGRIIPNDHLKYRSSLDRGSDVSIQDANLLKLRVSYCYPMFVPIASRVIKRLMGVENDPDPLDGWTTPTLGSFRDNCFRNDRIPIVAQAIVRMQTPIKNDTFAASCD